MKFGIKPNLTEREKKAFEEQQEFIERLERAPKIDPMSHPLFRRWVLEDEHRIAKAKEKRAKRAAEAATTIDREDV